MPYFLTPKIETCYSCHKGTARPRIQEIRTNTKIIVEAKWVCPNCGNIFKHGVIEEKALPNATK